MNSAFQRVCKHVRFRQLSPQPLVVTAVAPHSSVIPFVAATSLLFLASLGGLAARAGGAGILTGALRVTFWGALAMGVTAAIGALFGTTV